MKPHIFRPYTSQNYLFQLALEPRKAPTAAYSLTLDGTA